jgi:predicted porin
MKKLLLATTAVAGLTVLSGQAMAQVTVTLGGYVRFGAAWIDDDQTAAEAAAGTAGRDFDFYTESELVVRADGKADNGLTYGAYVELEIDQDGDAANGVPSDEANIYVAGGWGRIELGDQDGASDVYGVITAPTGFGTGAWDSAQPGVWTRNATAAGATGAQRFQLPDPKAPDSGDQTKITYYTPNFAGFQAGVSYAPQVGGTNEGQNVNRNDFTGGYQDLVEVGVRYTGEFAGASVAVAGTYTFAENTATAAGLTANEDLSAYFVGAQVGYAGFLVGGSYMSQGDSNQLTTAADVDQFAWAVGVQYTAGPIVVGVDYVADEVAETVAGANRTRERDAWFVGGTYTIAPGLSTSLDVVFFEDDRAVGSATADQDGTAVVLTQRVAF